MTIAIVIDDNRYTADSLCQMLTLFDMEPRVAYGPRAGLLALSEIVPDIVFIDINMPGVSGFEVLAYVRREPRLMNVPVVVVTADDQKSTAQKAHQDGALAVIIKPATLDAIEDTLKAAKLL